MIVEELKKSILQSAMNGSLSSQFKSNVSIDEMLNNILIKKQNYKSKLNNLKRSSIKEYPYEIPETWKWVELKDIALDIYAGGDKPKNFSKEMTGEYKVPVVSNGEKNDGIMGYTDEAKETETAITVSGRGTIGYSSIRNYPFTPIVRLLVVKVPEEVDYDFLKYVFGNFLETGIGSAVKQLTVPMIVNKLIPLPPIDEQKYIVNKVKELFSKLDEVKPIEEKIEEIKNKFPEDMKKALLLHAISGKLTKQNEEEKIKIDLKSQYTITEPFEIPDNWRWYSHNDLFEIVGGSQPPKSKFVYTPQEGYIQLYQTRDYGINPQPVYVNINDVSKFSKKGDIILARYGGSLGKVFWAEDGAYNVALAKVVIKYPEIINDKYLYYYYLSDLYQTKVKNGNRSAQAGFSREDLNDLMFPLPPIEEQRRIVEKLEEVLPLIENI